MGVRQLIHRPVARLAMLVGGLTPMEYRRHPRAKIKWPVVMTTSEGLVDGQTQNLSCCGAFIRCARMPNLNDDFRLVITTKERLILVTAEVVWSDVHTAHGKPVFRGLGVRFINILNDDRRFLRRMIANHP